MSLHETALRAELGQALDALDAALKRCLGGIRADYDLPAWVWRPAQGETARQTAARAIEQIDYDDGQAPGAVIICPGLLGSSGDTLALAREVNAIKIRLQTVLVAMEKIRIKRPMPDTGELISMSLARYALQAMGRARLNRHQAWRQLRILDAMPSGAGFTWAHTRKVKRIDVKTAQRWLTEKGDGADIERQRQLLAQLPADEPLAYVKPSPVHVRVNLSWNAPEGSRCNTQVCAPLPVFLPCVSGQELPPFSALSTSTKPDANRRRRSDRKVEDTPFLPAVHVYRYLPWRSVE